MATTKKTASEKEVKGKKAPTASKTVKKEVAKVTAPKASASAPKKVEPPKPAPKAAAVKSSTSPVSKLHPIKVTPSKAPAAKAKKPAAEAKPEPKQSSGPVFNVIEKSKKKRGRKPKIQSKPKPDMKHFLEAQAAKKKAEKESEQKVIPPKPSVRYSDEDLDMFGTVIQEARREALDELRMLKERLEDLTNYDFAEESMIYSMHMAEQGSEAMEKEKTYAQIQRINEYIKKLDEAMQRIQEKTYGICRICGCLIAKERLLAVPVTTLSASYKIHQKCPEDGIDRIEPLK